MIRSLFVLLIAAAPLLAQARVVRSYDQPPPSELNQPQPLAIEEAKFRSQFGPPSVSERFRDDVRQRFTRDYKTHLTTDTPASLPNLLADEYTFRRQFGPQAVSERYRNQYRDDSVVDREAYYRQLPPQFSEEVARALEAQSAGLLRKMQGLWRVETFMLNGQVVRPERFAGLKYYVQDSVLVQSETSLEWLRPAPTPKEPSRLQSALAAAGEANVEPGLVDKILREVVETEEEWLGPAGSSHPTGAVPSNEPKDERSMRFLLYQRAPGSAQGEFVTWDRFAEPSDPTNVGNRPFAHYSSAVYGSVEVGDDRMIIAARGPGLKSFLTFKWSTPELGTSQTMFVRLVRDNRIATSRNPAPTNSVANGSLALALGGDMYGRATAPIAAGVPDSVYRSVEDWPFKAAGQPGQDLTRNSAVPGKWVVQAPTRVDLTRSAPDTVTQKPQPKRLVLVDNVQVASGK